MGGGEVTPTGAWQGAGGDPGGYVNIVMPFDARNDTIGGYWQQPLTVTESTITNATCSFDWSILNWTAPSGVDSYQLYVFLDTAAGAPTLGTQVWSSGEQTGTTAWSGTQNIDCTSKITGTGTYYYKIAVWLDAVNSATGPITMAIDNAQASWTKTGETYPTDRPTVTPTFDAEGVNIGRWTGFIETATKNGGEIYYQLSEDDGASWQYWNGTAWVNATTSNYNTAATIATQISQYPVTNQQLRIKAFMESNGAQEVILDDVEVTWIEARVWPFTTASNYIYNSSKIEVAGGNAHLLGGPGEGYQAESANKGFDTGTSPQWSFNTWGASVGQTGAWVSTGGNPGGWARISMPGVKNNVAGGYFQQNTQITQPVVTFATMDLDWIVSQYTGPANSVTVYLWVDQSNTAPVVGNEFWNSGNVLNTTSWQSMPTIDLSSVVNAPGNYYIKVGVVVDYGNFPGTANSFAVGFDNVVLKWGGTVPGGLPTDNPSITPTSSFEPGNFNGWASFKEEAIKEGTAEVYYQLCNDDIGVCDLDGTWKYWNGSAWANAGPTNYNTAVVIDANIGSFPIGEEKIAFKAFLSSPGNAQIYLDGVTIEYTSMGGAGGYATLGLLTSSAFNTGDALTNFEIIEFDADVPGSCSPVPCEVQVQLRVAPDNAGAPGAWTDWFGATGVGTFFTESFGTLIPLEFNEYQWVQYRAELRSDGVYTPILYEVRLNYK